VTALFTVYNSDGPAGRCDATCYDAKHQRCDCICRGRNHGKGRAAAEAISRELIAAWADIAARLGGLPFDRVEIDPSVTHDSLF
jgi:hypothetical protein